MCYVWPMKTMHPNYLAPKQFSKMADGVLVFKFNFVFTWVIPIACVCAYVASEKLQSKFSKLVVCNPC